MRNEERHGPRSHDFLPKQSGLVCHVFVTVSIFVRTLSLSLSLDSLCVFELYAGGSSLLIASHGAQVLALRTDSIACKGVNGRTYETWKDSLTRGSRVGKILATWLAPNSCIFPCTAILGRSKDMYDHKTDQEDRYMAPAITFLPLTLNQSYFI